MGWEPVIVRRKYPAGHLDIQFQDGEVMRECIPRIQRQPTGSPATSAAPRNLPSPDRPARPSTARPAVQHEGAPDRPGDHKTTTTMLLSGGNGG
eukprot:CAMPEP_0195133552 /NCGR_PEP_ID=MMETSP0448-20130528/149024_1 /TAXON_ID=66468 /ORGANISM="Heterocapsa triquestra, Strain CCMP 448" /LENGTH=93 /DNA_ID=CAMNT_0040171605 /DNA_START=1 /DNA_END=278 /DNA_ORIENTATION=+